MGYIRDDGMVIVLGPGDCFVSAGTWTPTLESSIWANRRSAAAAPFYLAFTPKLLQSGGSQKGSYLESVDLYWKVSQAAVTSLAATVNLLTLPEDGSAFSSPSALEFTYDTGHDAAGERVTADEHKMTLTLDTPIWVSDDELIQVELVVVATGTAVFDWYGAAFHFSLRL